MTTTIMRKPSALAVFGFILSLFFTLKQSSGQGITVSSVPDIPITSATNVDRINCDMLEIGINTYLSVVVWDDPSTGDAYLWITDGTNSDNLTITGGAKPDVVLGDDGSSYMIGLVYESGGDVYFESYPVTLSPVTIGTAYSGSPVQLNTNIAGSPHIDLWHDLTMITPPSNFTNYLYEFAIAWHEFDGLSQNEINCVFGGNLNSPGVFSTPPPIATNGMYPDIACFHENAAPFESYFVVTHADNSGQTLFAREYNISTTNPGNSYTLHNGSDVYFPRIDAVGYASRQVPSQSDWEVVASVDVSGNRKVMCYDAANGNNIVGYFPNGGGFDYNMPVVCAGPGPVISNQGNWFAIGFYPMYDTSMYFNRSMEPNGFSGNWSELNNGTLGISGDPALAISTSTNTAVNYMAAWFDGTDVLYKLTTAGSPVQFRPTAIKEQAPVIDLFVYPNPASNYLNVVGVYNGQYTITDMTGRIWQSGMVTNKHRVVDIAGLAEGIYLLTILQDGESSKLKFAKQ